MSPKARDTEMSPQILPFTICRNKNKIHCHSTKILHDELRNILLYQEKELHFDRPLRWMAKKDKVF